MSLYVRALTSEEGAELNRIARNGNAVKFARRAQVVIASGAHTPVNQIARVMGTPSCRFGASFMRSIKKALMVSDQTIEAVAHQPSPTNSAVQLWSLLKGVLKTWDIR